jgi:hypothetical protein
MHDHKYYISSEWIETSPRLHRRLQSLLHLDAPPAPTRLRIPDIDVQPW